MPESFPDMPAMKSGRELLLEQLKWQKFEIGSDGFVCLVDVMGDDSSVIQAARVSYGAGTKRVSDDNTLIRYLMRKHHGTPFEMATIKFMVRVPMDCWRQWIRHRTASVNEYSTRYSEAIDSRATTLNDEWRLQSKSNKQGSSGYVEEWPEDLSGVDDWETKNVGIPMDMPAGEYLTQKEAEFHGHADRLYKERLHFGVAREQARKDLPLSTYTEAYWQCNLRGMLHFLSLRMDAHAQQEIREYATVIGEKIIAPLFPSTWQAFLDYHLNAMHLTRLDIEVMQRLQLIKQVGALKDDDPMWPEEWRGLTKCRERDECIAKLKKLGLVVED